MCQLGLHKPWGMNCSHCKAPSHLLSLGKGVAMFPFRVAGAAWQTIGAGFVGQG